jgi:hypothetical protein
MSFFQKGMGYIKTDKAGGSGDQDFHEFMVLTHFDWIWKYKVHQTLEIQEPQALPSMTPIKSWQ